MAKISEQKRNKSLKTKKGNTVVNDAKAADISVNKPVILDSMYNLVSGLGIQGVAKTPSSYFKPPKILQAREWEDFYAGNGVARRIIDTIANEMTREWVTLDGDDAQYSLDTYLSRLDAQVAFADLVRWAKLFGGAIIIMLIDDGRDLSEEVDLGNIKTIEALRVVDLGQITLYPTDYYSDPASPKFNEPEWYTIVPILYGVPSKHLMFKVHETRVLKLDGAPATQYLKRLNKGWMAPVMQSYLWDIINLEQAYSYAAESVHEMIISLYGIKGLSTLMTTQNGEQLVKQRLDIINYAKSLINAVVIDADAEKFEKVMTNVSQIEALLTKFEKKVCAMSGLPYSILFGDQRSGIVSAENSDTRSWYDNIRQQQMQSLYPLLKKLLQYMSLAKDCTFTGDITKVLPNFNALWQYEEKDLVAMQYQTAQGDAIYIDRGVITPEEARKRFTTNKFNFELRVEEEPAIDYSSKTIAEITSENQNIKINNNMDVGAQ